MFLNFANILAEANEAVNIGTATAAQAVTADTAATTTTAAAGGGELITTVVMFAAMIAIFYFLLIRPQRKKDKQVKQMLDALKPGDKVCTIGGLYCTIAAIKDDKVTVTMGAQQNTVVIARWAIRSVENVALENDAEPQI